MPQEQWNSTALYAPFTTNQTTVEELEQLRYIHIGKKSCLGYARAGRTKNSNRAWSHPRNPFTPASGRDHLISGTTVWINEWMTIGHALYDTILLQILASTKVDRIVLQRSSHDVDHLGDGLGTWEMWFKNFYAAIIMATQPGVPIYVRFREPLPHTAHFLSIDEKSGVVTDRVDSGNLLRIWQGTEYYCGDTIITRNHDPRVEWLGHNAFSPDAIARFRYWAYILTRPLQSSAPRLRHDFPTNGPMVITHHYRHAHASRHMTNWQVLREALQRAFPAPRFLVRSIETTEQTSASGALQQIRDTAETQVLITEHGATQSNLLYLRNASFLLDLRGHYFKEEKGHIAMVRGVAQAAGVFFDYVYTANLANHEQQSFAIQENEVAEVVRKVQSYVDSQVYKINMSG